MDMIMFRSGGGGGAEWFPDAAALGAPSSLKN